MYDAVDDYDEGSRRSANLHLASPENGDDETCHDGSDDTFLRRYARGDAEGYCQWQRYDADDNSRHEVGHESLAIVVLKCLQQLWLEHVCCDCLHFFSFYYMLSFIIFQIVIETVF